MSFPSLRTSGPCLGVSKSTRQDPRPQSTLLPSKGTAHNVAPPSGTVQTLTKCLPCLDPTTPLAAAPLQVLSLQGFLAGPSSDAVRSAAESKLLPCRLGHPHRSLYGWRLPFPVSRPQETSKVGTGRGNVHSSKATAPVAPGLATRAHCPPAPLHKHTSKAVAELLAETTPRLAHRRQKPRFPATPMPGRGREDRAGFGVHGCRSWAVWPWALRAAFASGPFPSVHGASNACALGVTEKPG